MDNATYVKEALRTDAPYTKAKCAIATESDLTIRVLHAAMGLCTESAEVMDALKKTIFYGKPLDVVNVKEELGDVFWYLAIACDELGVSFEDIQRRNIEKLKARYPEKFTPEKALNRDLETERKILEKK